MFKSIGAWLTKWGWLLMFAVGAFVFRGKGRSWWRTLKEEHRFVDVRAKTAQLLEQQEYEKAVIHVKTVYQDKLVKMTEEHRAVARNLEADPEQLAAYLAALHL